MRVLVLGAGGMGGYAARTAAGRGYEKDKKKLQDAIDEHYAGTLNGLEVARVKVRKEKAAAEAEQIESA